jgi:hypothetical protein
MPNWNDKHPCCRNCKTTRRYRAWKGHCWLCTPLAKKATELESTPEPEGKVHVVERMKQKARLQKANWQLDELRRMERPLLTEVSGQDLQEALITLAQVADVRDPPRERTYRLYWISEKIFEDKFSSESREWLYQILIDMIEHLPSPMTRRLGATRPLNFAAGEASERHRHTTPLSQGPGRR